VNTDPKPGSLSYIILGALFLLGGLLFIYIGYRHYVDGTIFPAGYKHGWMTGRQTVSVGILMTFGGLRIVCSWISVRRKFRKSNVKSEQPDSANCSEQD
jgi:hypothetical protein